MAFWEEKEESVIAGNDHLWQMQDISIQKKRKDITIKNVGSICLFYKSHCSIF